MGRWARFRRIMWSCLFKVEGKEVEEEEQREEEEEQREEEEEEEGGG